MDLGTGDNNKINWALTDKQEFIDIIEMVYRGARKGRGLVVGKSAAKTTSISISNRKSAGISLFLFFFDLQLQRTIQQSTSIKASVLQYNKKTHMNHDQIIHSH